MPRRARPRAHPGRHVRDAEAARLGRGSDDSRRARARTSATTEVVHIGQTVIALGGTVDYLVDTVFNYPTLAESYQVAALDARDRLLAVERIAR